MFDLVKCSKIGNIDTSDYYVFLDKEYTLKSFVEEVLKMRPKETTKFTVHSKELSGVPFAIYHGSELRNVYYPKLFSLKLSDSIIDVKAYEDNSSMNFDIKVA